MLHKAQRKRKVTLAKYRCCICGNRWKQPPAPVECTCGSLHVEWVNWKNWAVREGFEVKDDG